MKSQFFRDQISKKFGPVVRARNCYLYTKKGVRLTDLYQEGGKAILGWGGSSCWTMFKNVLSRGICGSFNTEVSGRIQKAISALLASEREVFAYESKQEALKASLACFPNDVMQYRPWNPESVLWSGVKCVLVTAPLAYATSMCYVCVLKECLDDENRKLFHSAFIPAPMEACVARSFYNLIQAIQERQEKDWFIYDQIIAKYWERKGPYLFPKVNQEKYDQFVVHCLENELIISPDFNVPSIVPFGADKGVFTKLKNNPFDI